MDGLLVVELSIAIAAPSCGRALAFHGADVVKIESRTNPDVARMFGSVWARDLPIEVYMDTSPYLGEMNANKHSVGLELKQPAALAAAKALIARADVFVTNYSTPAVRALGLGYDDLVTDNPDLVYIALPGFGSDPDQPYYEFLAWGPNQAPLTGLDALTGHADQEPAGIATTAPPDYFAGLHALAAVLTALHHRDVTGEGSFVDIAQFETTVSSLGPFLLDHALTGRSVERSGNRLPWLAPQGCYPCLGHDKWVAITVGNDEEWAALASVVDPSAGDDERFADVAGRIAHHDELDERIGAWTAHHTASEVATWLQEAGVPAHEVLDNIGVIHDPQVHHRHWFQMVESARFPEGDVFSGHPIRLTGSPGRWWRAGPSMGQDTVEILTERAGLEPAQVAELLASGVAFTDSAPEHTLRRPYSDYAEILGVRGSAG